MWREATALPNADVESRLVSAAWGETALTADLDPDDALDAFAACLDANAALAGRGAARSDVEGRLARWNGLAGSAAVAAVRAGRPGRALEMLEYGRTLMWNRLLDDRSELDGLRLVEPALADEVEMLRAELDVAHAGGAGGQVDAAERIAVLDRRWDALVERVRAAGVHRLHAAARADPAAATDLARAGRRAHATSHGSHALVVRPAGVQVIELPGLSARPWRGRRRTWTRCTASRRTRRPCTRCTHGCGTCSRSPYWPRLDPCRGCGGARPACSVFCPCTPPRAPGATCRAPCSAGWCRRTRHRCGRFPPTTGHRFRTSSRPAVGCCSSAWAGLRRTAS